MCCAEFIVKYVLFIANVMFTLAGIALIGVGIAVLVQINELLELIPVNINAIPIAIIVLGSIVFAIAFFGCCGAIRESRCLLTMYFVCMGILAAGKIYLAIVIFGALDTILTTVQGWITDAFEQENLRVPFHVMETLFKCCGPTGPGAYDNILPGLPPSCCRSTVEGVCQISDAFQEGCNNSVGWYFETFGEAIGGVLITIIIFELVAMFFGMFMCWAIGDKRSKQRYY